jgi:hypothetical protein
MPGIKVFIAPAAPCRVSHVLIRLLMVLTVGTIALACFGPISSPDFWWQLAEGRQMLATQRVNTSPLHAFGLPSSPFANEYIIYDVLIALAHKVIGMPGLRVLFGIVNILPFVLVSGIWLRCRRDFRFSDWFALALAAALLFVRLRQRPEIIGSVLFVGLGLILLLRGFPSYLSHFQYFIVGVILCLWSNFHSSFIIGLGVVGLWASETAWRNRARQDFKKSVLSGLCLIAVAVTGAVINPVGLNRLSAPLSLQTNFWSIAITDEMWPIPLHWYWAISIILFFGSYVWFFGRSERRPLWLLVIFIATALLALISQRHVNLLGCVMLLLFVYRITCDAEPGQSNLDNTFALACRTVFSLAMVAVLSTVLFFLVRHEIKQWHQENWAFSNEHYAPDALEELHRREPQGTPFLAGTMVSAYMQGRPEYRLRPLIDTGLSRFSNDTAKFFFYLDNQPSALRLALQQLDINYVVVSRQNAHWAVVLNGIPDWSIAFVSANGILYQRDSASVRNLTGLAQTIKDMAPKIPGDKKITIATFYTMGLLSPDKTIDLLATAEPDWWHEPNINFILDWLDRIPLDYLKRAMTRLSIENPSELRLRIILALRLGLLDDAKALFRTSKLSTRDLEDAVLKAEVLLAGDNPCDGRKILSSIFPRRDWSVRLAELVNRMKQFCQVASDEAFVSPKIPELVWSKELELWIQNMSHKLNQRILTDHQPASFP